MRGNLVALALIVPLLGCPPTRTEDPGGTPTPSNDFQTALFTIVDYGEGAQYQDATLVLADMDLTCDDLNWRGDLDAWSIPEGVSWVHLYISHGVALDGWLRTYESYASAQQGGVMNGDEIRYFWGEAGEGPVEDDIPVGEPPPTEDPAGRAVTATLGMDAGASDLLDVTLSSDDLLGGSLDTSVDTWSFAATKCGVVSGGWDGTDPDDPPDDGGDDGGDDAGGDNGSGSSEGNPGN